MKKHTISDVARQAGVSVATVSRVINHNDKVDNLLRERVMKAVDALGYVPNAEARSIRAGNSSQISVIIPTAEIAIFASVLQGVMDRASEQGLRVQVYASKGEEEQDLRCLREAIAGRPRGVIYCPISGAYQEYLQAVSSHRTPVVVVMRRGQMAGVPHIYMDDFNGAYRAAKYLIQQGHRRIAFFAGFWKKPVEEPWEILRLLDSRQRGAYSTLERLAGYCRALEEAQMELDEELICLTRFDYQSGYEAMREFLSRLTSFDSVLCGNDLVAAGAMQALKEQNIPVPERVSLVGYDDSDLARISSPRLTSVRQLPYSIGERAVDALTGMAAGETVENQKLDAVLSIGMSTAAKR